METKFGEATRKHLEWSWNCAIAEQMADDTTRHNAQWISSGIVRGEDADDRALVLDWLSNRVTGEDLLPDEWWEPEHGLEAFNAEIRSLPDFVDVVAEAKECWGEEEE